MLDRKGASRCVFELLIGTIWLFTWLFIIWLWTYMVRIYRDLYCIRGVCVLV